MKNILRLPLAIFVLLLVAECSTSDDPKKTLPKLSIDDVAAEEGETALFTVSLSEASTEEVSFSYKTTHVTTSDADFFAVNTPNIVTIPAGQLRATILVTMKEDEDEEQSEKFNVVISDPKNAELSDDVTGIGTINNVAVAFYMKVKIDGAQWNATMDGFFAAEFIDITFGGYGSGTFYDSQLSFVFFEEPDHLGNYDIVLLGAENDNEVGVYWTPDFFSSGGLGTTYYGQPDGEFSLTMYDTDKGIAEGTFHFTAKDEEGNAMEFTEGKFRVAIE